MSILETVLTLNRGLFSVISSLVGVDGRSSQISRLRERRLDLLLARLEASTEQAGSEPVTVEFPSDQALVEVVARSLREGFSDTAVSALRQEYEALDVGASTEESRERLEGAASSLESRINQNLVLGTIFALAGMGVLAYFVFSSPALEDPMLALVYFVPRITIVLVVEVFSYFFLNLYRSGLSDLKYYHNELTGVEARRVAMQFAARSKDDALVRCVVERVVQTDRNQQGAAGTRSSSTNDHVAALKQAAELVKAVSP